MKKHLPPLKSLPAFLAVAKNLSFSKAARELHVTHSAISQSVRILETFLGQQLFIRQGNKIALTASGKEYYYAINAAVDLIAEATRQQLQMHPASNLLTVNVISTLAMRWLIARLPDFQAKHPEIDLRLSTVGSKEFDFVRDGIDVALAYGCKEDWVGFETQKIADDKLVLVGNKTHEHTPLEKLLQTAKAIYIDAELRRSDWKLWCAKADIREPKKEDRIYFKNSAQALQAAVSGVGILVTHYLFVVDDIQQGNLSLLSKVMLSLDEKYYLIYPKNKLKLKNVESFCKWLPPKL